MTASPIGAPLVSIVVPVYNGAPYLRESLDSILAQTYRRIEVLVMDDASTDATPEIAAAYGERVRYHRQPRNRGIYGNTNDGIGLSRGSHVAVYHADDVYDPRIVEREVDFLERFPQAGAVFCQDVFINPAGRQVGRLELPPEVRGGRPLDYPVVLNALLTYRNRFLRCPSSMVRAAVYRAVGGYRDATFFNTSDLEMWLRIARRYPIGIIEEHLFRYRQGHGSSAQRYHHLRTAPERFFTIMDLYLDAGGRAEATAEALAAYEAHRAEDGLMRAVCHYILDELDESRRVLRAVSAHRLLASGRVQRGRLLLLLVTLHCLTRVPRISLVASSFRRRWHEHGATGPLGAVTQS